MVGGDAAAAAVDRSVPGVGLGLGMHVHGDVVRHLGKIIRSVFPRLKTRRLGPRGKTKHHYHGISISSASKLQVHSLPPTSSVQGAKCERGTLTTARWHRSPQTLSSRARRPKTGGCVDRTSRPRHLSASGARINSWKMGTDSFSLVGWGSGVIH